MDNKLILKSSALVLGGATVGFGVAQIVLSRKYKAMVDTEVAQLKEYYEARKGVIINQTYATPAEAVADLVGKYPEALAPDPVSLEAAKAFAEYSGDDPGVAEDFTANIFDAKFTTELTDEEIEARNPAEPYIISVEEYLENGGDFEQVDLTYWEGDEVLSDDNDQMVPDPESIVGKGNLELFGHGSADENVVYVRNEDIRTVFEIKRDLREFAVEVMGIPEDHLEHSAPMRRRGRRDDRDL